MMPQKVRPQPQSLVTPESAKTLESFPSLSPDASPATISQSSSRVSLDCNPRRRAVDSQATPKKASTVAQLVHSSPSFYHGNSLFEADYTNLAHATDSTIHQVAAQNGVVSLVRRMAGDLQERTTELAQLRKRAEDREQALRRMLMELKITNSDIDKSLYAATNLDEAIGEAMSVAMDDYLDDFSIDRDATVKARAATGWKKFLWGKSSDDEVEPASRRRSLKDDLFEPPDRHSPPSRKSSKSVSSWTSKLFSTKDDAPQTAKDALIKVSGQENTPKLRRKSSKVFLAGQNGNLKSSPVPPVPPLPMSPTIFHHGAGPVEMNTIYPSHSKPPTLASNQATDDTPTDRFGFIYDQRRRQKEAQAMLRRRSIAKSEATSSSRGRRNSAGSAGRPSTPASSLEIAEDSTPKRWQDYLIVSTTSTELLSQTPVVHTELSSSVSSLVRSGPDAWTSLSGQTAKPEVTPALAGSITADQEEEPAKLLLDKLTEMHDKVQQEKTVRWNGFLRAQSTPDAELVDGEFVGVAGLGNKGKDGRAKWKEFKGLVLGGIPVSYRAKIWAECSGASAMRVPGYYDDLVAQQEHPDPTTVAQIEMDIHRTLTDNVFFRSGPGVTKLKELLLAYSRRNPEVGYCQGMNMIAGSLLLIMATAEDAFWMMTSMIETILPPRYYDATLLDSRADQQVLREYVAEILPKLASHLDDLGIEIDALTFQWFLSVFTDCLSAEALFRVWDVIFCFNDGSTFMFQVAVALLKLNEVQLMACDNAARAYSYIANEMTDHAISIDGLVRASAALKNVIRRQEVEQRRSKAVAGAREDATDRYPVIDQPRPNGIS